VENRFSPQKGQGLVEYSLVLVLIFLVIIVALVIGGNLFQTVSFDNHFTSGESGLVGNAITLGEIGHPEITEYDVNRIPLGSGVGPFPRRFVLDPCYSILIYGDSFYVATNFANPELIFVQMPINSNGYANICGPAGANVEIILWAK
jgi:hypothetical protein